MGQESVLVISWGSVVFKGSTVDTRLLFSAILTRHIEDATVDTLYSVLQWSFEALATGRFPAKDHEGKYFSDSHHPDRFAKAGRSLAGGLVGAWAEMRGDWKYLKDLIGF